MPTASKGEKHAPGLARGLARVLGFSRRGPALHGLALLAGAALLLACGGRGTQDAVANGDTRTLDLYHAHTKESLRITFKRDGAYERDALEKLNWFLRDWRKDEPTSMAPGIFDLLWYAHREAGASEPIVIVSAYRSPGTNEMLRRRSRAVAKESQHIRGNAVDFHIPGMHMGKVREIGMRLQRGGVGYYPTAGTPFVHLDVGSVRSWPRMPREQLERLFPDGKTVHLPADGIPLANYQVALAEIQARGGNALDFETVTSNRGKSLWALLFGGDDDEDRGEVQASTRLAARGGRPRNAEAPAPQVAARLPHSYDNVSADNILPIETGPASRRAIAAAAPAPAPVPANPAPTPPLIPLPGLPAPIANSDFPTPPARPREGAITALAALAEPLPPVRPIARLAEASGETASPNGGIAPASIGVLDLPLPPIRAPLTQLLAAADPIPSALPLPPARPGNGSALAAAPVPVPNPASVPNPNLEATASIPLPSIIARGGNNAPPLPEAAQAFASLRQAHQPPSAPPVPRVAGLDPAKAPPAVTRPLPVRLRPDPAAKEDPRPLISEHPAIETPPDHIVPVAEPSPIEEIRRGIIAMPLAQPAPKTASFSGGFIRPLAPGFIVPARD